MTERKIFSRPRSVTNSERSCRSAVDISFQNRFSLTRTGTEKTLSSDSSDNELLVFYQKSITQLLLGLGLSEEQTRDALIGIDLQLTISQHKSLRRNQILSPFASNQIYKLQEGIFSMLQKQKKVAAAVNIQRMVRGHIVRKRTSNMTTKDKKKLKGWTGAVSQIITTEKRYIKKLQGLVSRYIEPLEKNPPPGTSNCLHYLNCNFPRIIEVHEILVEELEKIQESQLYPFVADLGKCLSENVNRIGPAYYVFAKKHLSSLETLNYFISSIQKFPQFIEEVSGSKNGQKSFQKLLQLPKDHLAALEKKIRTIYKNYNVKAPDYELLGQVITTIGFFADSTKSQIDMQGFPAQLQNMKRILAVEWQIEVSQKPLNLLSWSKRSLLKEGTVRINGKKSMHIHLFTDLAILSETGSVNTFKFVKQIGFHHTSIVEENEKDFSLIIPGDKEPLSFKFNSKSEASEWLSRISQVIETYDKNRVYGVPLAELLEKEQEPDGIPKLLKETLSHIGQKGCDVEGIFRVPGDSIAIQEYRELYDSGMAKEIDFSIASIHDVAGLCKLYLRELPIPLVPFTEFDNIVKIEKEFESHKNEETHNTDVANVIGRIPRYRQKVLKFVLTFLKEFSVNSGSTKMNIENLSMVFTPNLVRPQVDTVDTAMVAPMVTRFVNHLVENQEKVWELIPSSDSDQSSSINELVERLLTVKEKSGASLSPVEIKRLKSTLTNQRPSKYISLSTTDDNPTKGRLSQLSQVDAPVSRSTSTISRTRRKKKNSTPHEITRSDFKRSSSIEE